MPINFLTDWHHCLFAVLFFGEGQLYCGFHIQISTALSFDHDFTDSILAFFAANFFNTSDTATMAKLEVTTTAEP